MYALETARIATPVGIVSITGDDRWVTAIKIEPPGQQLQASSSSPVSLAIMQLEEWFAGERTEFDLPLAPAATSRGMTLRNGMIAIPYGETLSYGTLARQIGSSPRAIGQACARNPFPIVVPCHRVTNANGSLGSYSAGDGPTTKQWLLDFERRDRRYRLL